MESLNEANASQYLAYNEEDLYAMLVPEHLRRQAYSKEGLIARGHEIFVSKIKQLQSLICKQYTGRGDTIKSSIDLTLIVATAIVGAPAMLGIPVLPVAALIVKIGLEEICKSSKKGKTK